MDKGKSAELKATLNLPHTSFPMKANLPQREPQLLEKWESTKLYEQIRKARKSAPAYTLHDGPPYANGKIHLGTALNKILKDMVAKSKTLAGFNVPYRPGWAGVSSRVSMATWTASSFRLSGSPYKRSIMPWFTLAWRSCAVMVKIL